MNRETIRALALAKGFTLKPQPDGTEDLNPYVYEFAEALLAPVKHVDSIETYPTTIAIQVPQNIDLKLGILINVQGFEVRCDAIHWEQNCIRKADVLEQRLSVALDLLETGNYMEKDLHGYQARLEELREDGELLDDNE